jgi:DNA-binding transcriptional ArsR family regulator
MRRFRRVLQHPEEAALLDYVPVRFDLYRSVRRHLRWTLQCLVGFADRTGRCFPSVRRLAEVGAGSRSTVSRHLAALERDGHLKRRRKPGGVYEYEIDSRFLPAERGVSHVKRRGVPRERTEEQGIKKTGSDSQDWEMRLRCWRKSRFWQPFWGPKPSERGCFAPPELLMAR